MLSALKTITNHIQSPYYPTTPLGEEVFAIDGNMTMIEAVTELQTIPRVEKNAVGLDLMEIDREVLNDPISYLRRRTQTDRIYLMHEVMGFKDVLYDYKYCRDISDFLDLRKARMLLVSPRWHIKSSCGVGEIVQTLLNDGEARWLIKSANEDSSKQLYEIVQNCLLNDNMQLIWGDLKGNKWTIQELNISTRRNYTSREPNVYYKGIGSDLTGHHPSHALLDDLSAQLNCETPEQREKVKRDYRYTVLLISERVLVLATRWHYDDLPGMILEENKQKSIKDRTFYHTFIKSVYDDNEQPLFPEKYPRQWIEDRRVELGVYAFACQMLNNPVDEASQRFKDSWVKQGLYGTLEDEAIKNRPMNYFITVDPASSDARYADYTVIMVAGVTCDMHVYVVEYSRKKYSTAEQSNIIFGLYEQWQPKRVGIEEGHYERTLKAFLKEKMRIKSMYFHVTPLKYGGQPNTRSRAKPDRIMSLTPYFEEGIIHIRREGMDALLNELQAYPYSKHDDTVDALAYMLQLIYPPGEFRQPQSQKTPIQMYLDRKRRGMDKNFVTNFVNEGVRYD